MSEGEHDSAAYQTGYGRPPVASRFKKGQSGNPRGRPRKTLPIASGPSQLELLWKESQRKMKASEGAGIIELSAHEALIRSVFAAAMKGRAAQQKMLLELFASAEIIGRRAIEMDMAELAPSQDARDALRAYLEVISARSISLED